MFDISEKKSNWPPQSIPPQTRFRAIQWINGLMKAIANSGKAETKKPLVPVQMLRAGDHFGLPSRHSKEAGVTWEVIETTSYPDHLLVHICAKSVTSGKTFSRYYPANNLVEARW